MKLFKSLLVAPASLGLLAPLAANANEINLNEIANYSDVESIQFANSFDNDELIESPLLAGGEGLTNSYRHNGAFSATTKATFSADFAIGAVDGIGVGLPTGEAVGAGYGFQIDLTTSFIEGDELAVSIDAGNAGSGSTANSFPALDELDLNDAGDGLQVDGISYTFPIGDKTTVFFGDNTPGSKLYNTACVYGSPTDTMDDCGAASAALDAEFGTSAGASFDLGNGFTAAIGIEAQGDTINGIFTKDGTDAYGAQITYTGDSYGASLTYANIESTDDTTYYALNGYWTPESTGSVPSISVGYEMGDPNTAVDTTQYFVGFQWDEIGDGKLGVAIGNTGPISENANSTTMYEAFYTYPIHDGFTVTPVIYVKEVDNKDDQTGLLVKTSFRF